MLVGHNPGVEQLLSYLVEDEIAIPDDGKLLPTATLARLILNCEWDKVGAGCARLDSITRPGSLPEKFPFPGPWGKRIQGPPGLLLFPVIRYSLSAAVG